MPDLRLSDGRILKNVPENISKQQIEEKLLQSDLPTGFVLDKPQEIPESKISMDKASSTAEIQQQTTIQGKPWERFGESSDYLSTNNAHNITFIVWAVILVCYFLYKFIYLKDKLALWNKIMSIIKSAKNFLHYFGKFLLFSIKWGLILWIGYLILQALKENLLGLIAGLLGIIIYQLNEIRIILLRRDCAKDLDNDV